MTSTSYAPVDIVENIACNFYVYNYDANKPTEETMDRLISILGSDFRTTAVFFLPFAGAGSISGPSDWLVSSLAIPNSDPSGTNLKNKFENYSNQRWYDASAAGYINTLGTAFTFEVQDVSDFKFVGLNHRENYYIADPAFLNDSDQPALLNRKYPFHWKFFTQYFSGDIGQLPSQSYITSFLERYGRRVIPFKKINYVSAQSPLVNTAVSGGVGVDKYVDLTDVAVPVPVDGLTTHYNAGTGKFEQVPEVKVDPITRDISQTTSGAVSIVADGDVGIQSNSANAVLAGEVEVDITANTGDLTLLSLGGEVNTITNPGNAVVTTAGGNLDLKSTGGTAALRSFASSVSVIGAGQATLQSDNNNVFISATGGETDVLSRQINLTAVTDGISLQAAAGDLILESAGGDYQLNLPSGGVQETVDGGGRISIVKNDVVFVAGAGGVGDLTLNSDSGNVFITANSALTAQSVGGSATLSGDVNVTVTANNGIAQVSGNTETILKVGGVDKFNADSIVTRVEGPNVDIDTKNNPAGIISLRPSADALSRVNISTVNKSSTQYATDIASLPEAVPNVEFVETLAGGLVANKVTKGGDVDDPLVIGSTVGITQLQSATDVEIEALAGPVSINADGGITINENSAGNAISISANKGIDLTAGTVIINDATFISQFKANASGADVQAPVVVVNGVDQARLQSDDNVEVNAPIVVVKGNTVDSEIILQPSSAAASYVQIGQVNKSATQYAVDIVGADEAVPNVKYVDDAVAGVDVSTKVTKGGDTDNPLVFGSTIGDTQITSEGSVTIISNTGAVNVGATAGIILSNGTGTLQVSSANDVVINSGDSTTIESGSQPLTLGSTNDEVIINAPNGGISASASGLVQVESTNTTTFVRGADVRLETNANGVITSGQTGDQPVLSIFTDNTAPNIFARADYTVPNSVSLTTRQFVDDADALKVTRGGDSGIGALIVGTNDLQPVQLRANATPAITIETTGQIKVEAPNYETLVTGDKVLTNKKYVDDAITAGAPALNGITDVTVTGTNEYTFLKSNPSGGAGDKYIDNRVRLEPLPFQAGPDVGTTYTDSTTKTNVTYDGLDYYYPLTTRAEVPASSALYPADIDALGPKSWHKGSDAALNPAGPQATIVWNDSIAPFSPIIVQNNVAGSKVNDVSGLFFPYPSGGPFSQIRAAGAGAFIRYPLGTTVVTDHTIVLTGCVVENSAGGTGDPEPIISLYSAGKLCTVMRTSTDPDVNQFAFADGVGGEQDYPDLMTVYGGQTPGSQFNTFSAVIEVDSTANSVSITFIGRDLIAYGGPFKYTYPNANVNALPVTFIEFGHAAGGTNTYWGHKEMLHFESILSAPDLATVIASTQAGLGISIPAGNYDIKTLEVVAPVADQVIKYDGTKFVNATVPDALKAYAHMFDVVPVSTNLVTSNVFVPITSGAFVTDFLVDFTHLDGVLTYTGTTTKPFLINCSVQSYGSIQDTRTAFQIRKNSLAVPSGQFVNYSKNSITFPETTSSNNAIMTLTTGDTVDLAAGFIEASPAITVTSVISLSVTQL
jgi:hypothetical protein